MRVRRTASIWIALVVAAAASQGPASGSSVPALSLREKIGQLVMFSIGGTTLSAYERDQIRKLHLGGVILFAHNYRDRSRLRTLTDQVQRAARAGNQLEIGALISADQEGGVVKRFPDMPPRYSAPEMGSSGRVKLAYDQGRATGYALRASGVNVNLAPVADLDLPPEHVMRTRSFGSGPRRVGRYARAFAQGLQSRRTAATAKHFPGFGGATVNSDYGRAYIYRTKWQLHHKDAQPFHAAIDAGLRVVMLSHGMYLKDGGRRPASVNHYIATRRLRREFSFTGVAISDDLDAVSWKFGGSTPHACKATIQAGVDVALITGGVDSARRCVARIHKAVASGTISEGRIDQALGRVLDLKAWLGLLPS